MQMAVLPEAVQSLQVTKLLGMTVIVGSGNRVTVGQTRTG
jgi:hypothetical protein